MWESVSLERFVNNNHTPLYMFDNNYYTVYWINYIQPLGLIDRRVSKHLWRLISRSHDFVTSADY